MKYKTPQNSSFIPWQPSSWPPPPKNYNREFKKIIKKIFNETIIEEIANIVEDARQIQGNLEHRGHVIALSLLCAIDTISSYAYDNLAAEKCLCCGRGDRIGPKYKKYIASFFPKEYQPFAEDIYNLYRNSMVHSWNLFKVGILPGSEQITKKDGVLSFGLLNFFNALKKATKNFLSNLAKDPKLQAASLLRYKELKDSALP